MEKNSLVHTPREPVFAEKILSYGAVLFCILYATTDQTFETEPRSQVYNLAVCTFTTLCISLRRVQATQTTSLDLKEQWVVNIVNFIRHHLKDVKKGWFNLDEVSWCSVLVAL